MSIHSRSGSRDWIFTTDGADVILNDLNWKALRLRILEPVIHNCPAYFFISLPDMPADAPSFLTAWQAGGGRGFTREAAKDAAIYEAIERSCLISAGTEDPRLTKSLDGLKPAITPLEWLNYSSNQLHNGDASLKDSSLFGCEFAVDNLWIRAEHLSTGEAVALPAITVLFGEDTRTGYPPVFSTSTGTALRDSVESATSHAIDELVERDCVAVWWYNCLPAARLELSVAGEALPVLFRDWLSARKRITWYLLLPTDLPVRVVVALSARRDGSAPAIAAAAAADPADAVRSATLELLQGEIALAHMRAAQRSEPPPPAPPLLAWSQTTNAFETPFLAGGETVDAYR